MGQTNLDQIEDTLMLIRFGQTFVRREIDIAISAIGKPVLPKINGLLHEAYPNLNASSVRALRLSQIGIKDRGGKLKKRKGIITVGDLLYKTEDDLLDIRNIGPVTVNEIKITLARLEYAEEVRPGFINSMLLVINQQGEFEYRRSDILVDQQI